MALRVGHALRRHGVRAVLTGGGCASLHSRGRLLSADADFVLEGEVNRERLDEAMRSVGFTRRSDLYVHPPLKFYVEFPRGPLAIGEDARPKPSLIARGRYRALALSPTDSCRDRLAAFYHWNDRQALRSAIEAALACRIRYEAIRRWSVAEGAGGRYQEFRSALRTARGH